jgi:2-isopropylmalate synthase
MTVAEKLKIAELLEQMGVDVIEAGFAIASEGDFRAVREIAKKVKDSVVCSLARAGRADIDRAAEALSRRAESVTPSSRPAPWRLGCKDA